MMRCWYPLMAGRVTSLLLSSSTVKTLPEVGWIVTANFCMRSNPMMASAAAVSTRKNSASTERSWYWTVV